MKMHIDGRSLTRPRQLGTTGGVESSYLVESGRIDRPAIDLSRGENAGTCSAIRRWVGRYAVAAEMLAALVALFTILRVVLIALHLDLGSITAGQLARVFLVGLRLDLMVGLIIMLPQILGMTLRSNRSAAGRVSRVFTHLSMMLTLLGTVFLCCAEFVFFDEFSSRFNYIAFEYLVYPTEVFGNIWESYPVVLLFSGVTVVAAVLYVLVRKRVTPMLQIPVPWPRRYALLGATALTIVALWLSTDMQSIEASPNRVANEIAGNGLYSVVHYAWTSRFDHGHFFHTIDLDEAYARVHRRIATPADLFHSSSLNPLDRTVTLPQPRRDYNVVLILEESFGSDFVGVLGDTHGLTPRFDALTKTGILFDNFYATGNRTARALEATLASFPPIPTESILKRDYNERVYTLGHVLADRGYRRVFITGGRGVFDGMRSFTMQNGFERFVEQKDYPAPTFVNAWGVCDEDIFQRALEEFDELHGQGRPFFGLVLTVSNHPPFTFPNGRIDLVRGRHGDCRGRFSGVKYADWALGEFFERARRHAFYQNTVFVVMGDHGARVYGADLFPIKSYRVPVLIILPDGKETGTRCSTLACSLDIAPTILDVLGGSYRSVFFGRDVLQIEPATGYALMQHNHNLALLEADNSMVILGCPRSVRGFQLDPSNMVLNSDTQANPEQIADAISFFQAADKLYYDKHWFPGRPIESAQKRSQNERYVVETQSPPAGFHRDFHQVKRLVIGGEDGPGHSVFQSR